MIVDVDVDADVDVGRICLGSITAVSDTAFLALWLGVHLACVVVMYDVRMDVLEGRESLLWLWCFVEQS